MTAARVGATLGSAAAVMLLGAGMAGAGAAPSYVALGDSYSSGQGTRTYIQDSTTCSRSTRAFPVLLATARGYSLNFRACSGATVANVRNVQLGALSPATNVVTISAGGNDIGFASVITECAKPPWAGNCSAAMARAEAVMRGELPARLTDLYSRIRSSAPNAKVIVVGYPRLFNGTNCNALTSFNANSMARLNAAADELNSVLARAASAAGFQFAHPVPPFIHHAVCDRVEWLNGLSYPVPESYHPNIAGHRDGFIPLVGQTLGTTVTIRPETVEKADNSAAALARQQRAYADIDKVIVPETFGLPTPPH